MIFAAYDYINYKKRTGPYGRSIKQSTMAMAWENGIPDSVIGVLEDGDPLFFLTFNSKTAWAIMYGTSSQVSHVGVYMKNQENSAYDTTLPNNRTY